MAEVRHLIRVFVAVQDPGRRASVARTFRANASMRFVDRESDADIVVADVESHVETLAEVADLADGSPVPGEVDGDGRVLTPREREVLLLVAAGLGNGNIGERLGISKSTVKYHLGAVFEKLGVHTRAEAVAMGLRRGIVLL